MKIEKIERPYETYDKNARRYTANYYVDCKSFETLEQAKRYVENMKEEQAEKAKRNTLKNKNTLKSKKRKCADIFAKYGM